jgi:cell division control protein 11
VETSTHLADLKALTHDVLYETYRTEKLSRTVNNDTQSVFRSRFQSTPLLTRSIPTSDSSILPEELATQSVRLKEEQLRREEEKVCNLHDTLSGSVLT